MKIDAQTYHESVDCYDGYCINCDDITRQGNTEPDAEEYECPECGKLTVIGIEIALINGVLEIT